MLGKKFLTGALLSAVVLTPLPSFAQNRPAPVGGGVVAGTAAAGGGLATELAVLLGLVALGGLTVGLTVATEGEDNPVSP
ncbi:hypothetical protein [Polymorphobacter sp.]|uniref:hypothetical protein n=1 Tax=Polymorphobacter sp. TaxID=1909290 RepID=UPI003F6FBFA4